MATGVGKTAAQAPVQRKRRGRTTKACEGCRALKTRCQFSPSSPVCDKCIELNRPCTTIPAPVKKSARKRRATSTKSPEGRENGRRVIKVNQKTSSSTDESSMDEPDIKPDISNMHSTDIRLPATEGSIDESSFDQTSSIPQAVTTRPQPQSNGEDAIFDTCYPPFDMRAVLDPGTYVPDPSPLPSEELDMPSLLDPEIPELFFGMDSGEFNNSESPEYPQGTSPREPAYTTNPKNRIRFNLSPMFITLRHLDPALQSGFGIASRLMKPRSQPPTPRNVITVGVISREHAIELIDIFKIHLTHWILVPISDDTVVLLDYLLQKCPLLVTVCCAVGLRLCSRDAWSRYYPALVDFMSKELSMTLARSPQSAEFLQAMMLLSYYGGTLSYQEHVFDMWYLSGIGIQQCMTNTALLDTLAHHHLRLWNHLVHVHMHSSIMTGRLPMVDDQCIDMCSRILKEPFADRFDSCILTEILIYDLSMQLLRARIPYDDFVKKVADWQTEWSMVLSLTTVQFSDTVRHMLEFSVRATHLRRVSNVSTSPTSAATLVDYPVPFVSNNDALNEEDLLTVQWFETLSTQELLAGLTQLNTAISGIVTPAAGRLFRYLSDMLHDIAFTSAVFSITLRKILAKRADVPADAEPVMSGALILTRRLAELLHATSRGADLQQSRCFALVRLLQDANLQHNT